jgi:hypothetical protein
MTLTMMTLPLCLTIFFSGAIFGLFLSLLLRWLVYRR